jgi:protoporphyrin/coproporphyrin ferrochelatase
MSPYDAFLLVSFGGPEGPDDVMPFLQNVTSGRSIPRERLEHVAEHYYLFGGVSPINKQCRDLATAIEGDLAAAGISLPVYWGNRNWQPYLADTLREMADAGVRRALAFVTSAYSSFSSCRQYLGDIERAIAEVGTAAPTVDKIRQYFNHPGFIEPFVTATAAAIESLPRSVQNDVDLVFTAHSIPAGMAAASGPAGGAYPAQLAEAARLVAQGLAAQGLAAQGLVAQGFAAQGFAAQGFAAQGFAAQGFAAQGFATQEGPQARSWRLAYQSRSGPPAQPWLGPDVSDSLEELARAGSRAVVVVPVGFVSDHMEVIFDLDVEASQTAQRLGLPMARAATPGTDRRFVAMVTELVAERLTGAPRRALGSMGPGPDFCQNGCCGASALQQAGRPSEPA